MSDKQQSLSIIIFKLSIIIDRFRVCDKCILTRKNARFKYAGF